MKLILPVKRFFLILGCGISKQKVKMINRLKGANSILFLCKGNICRSPFAEEYAKSKLPSLNFYSAGINPKDGKESPDLAIVASRSFNIDLSKHGARKMSQKILDKFDIILVFDLENLMDIRKHYPQVKDKTFIISHIIDEPWIDDPYGKRIEEFQNSYKLISESLDRIIEIKKTRKK